ncbi:MAG TPA: hypothetical protein VK166_11490 [Chitinophagaceae bacterium]|nr:hypothetical protein [Chitinophagaceae bacterium]
MRKLITAMALFMLTGTMSFAGPGPVDVKVSKFIQAQLMEAFPDAEHVSWDKMGDYYLARFTNSMGTITAYLDEDGAIYKVARYIDTNSLPLAVQRSLNEKYDLKENETVLEVTRNNNQTYYLVSFEHQNRKYIVESDLTGNLKVVKKSKV